MTNLFQKIHRTLCYTLIIFIIYGCKQEQPTTPTPQTQTGSTTLTPITIPNPKFEFLSGFDQGLNGFNQYFHEQGGVLQVINDPTGSNKGKVLKGTITGSPGSDGTYRIYPTKSFPFQNIPCRVQEDIWMSRQYYDDVRQGRSAWYSHLGLFDKGANIWHPIITIGWGNSDYMHLNIKGETGSISSFPPRVPDAPRFTPETWHTITAQIDASRMAYFYQDNQLVAQGLLHPASLSGIEFVHGGPIYGAPSLRPGSYVLVDNFHIVCW